jgi:hypothetical protein
LQPATAPLLNVYIAAYSVVEISLQLKNLNRMGDNQPLEVSIVIPCLNEAEGPKARTDHGR